MVYAAINIKDFFPPSKISNIATLLNLFLSLLMIVGIIMSLFMGIYGAYLWLTSEGSQENLAKAQKIFINTLLGLFLVVFSFTLIKIIGYILNIKILP